MKLSAALTLLALILVQSDNVMPYKILGVFPTTSRSHYYFGRALMQGLAAAGHEVTIVSPYKEKAPLKNYREVQVTDILKEKCV